ncbi:hypothetical protein B0J13DRAFT_100088 [Dactylonectria estremocensis]|uniref:Secreted protein n=1 Tax=Dactylonectria estremocensis TaxID=1079267 RepID=A0A9P9EA47_9HYPO|nr:hypothetical protein B0J13DRAFT_100088 [Dactylonectria estremocensis]
MSAFSVINCSPSIVALSICLFAIALPLPPGEGIVWRFFIFWGTPTSEFIPRNMTTGKAQTSALTAGGWTRPQAIGAFTVSCVYCRPLKPLHCCLQRPDSLRTDRTKMHAPPPLRTGGRALGRSFSSSASSSYISTPDFFSSPCPSGGDLACGLGKSRLSGSRKTAESQQTREKAAWGRSKGWRLLPVLGGGRVAEWQTKASPKESSR